MGRSACSKNSDARTPVQPDFRWAVLRVVLPALLSVCFIGCSPSKQPSITEPKYPSFVQVTKPKGCECAPLAVRFARAGLGLDPTKETVFEKPEELLKKLNEEASSMNSVITQNDVSECLDELANRPEPGPCDPMILVHPLGHLYLLLGTVTIENVLTYQIIHGDSTVGLVDREGLDKAGFTTVWKFHKVSDEIPVNFAGSHFTVDRIHENFGKVAPLSELKGQIQFTNTGKVPLVFETEVSCRCTVPDEFDGTELEPGASRDLAVTFQSSAGSAERHSVFVTCYEKGSGYSERLELLLLASQQQPLVVEPSKLDFGEVRKGETYKRTVNLTEVPTDRFSVTGFDANDNPLRGTVKTANEGVDLKTYQVDVEFTPDEPLDEGSFKYFTIETNSLLRPSVRIPFEYVLKSGVYSEPDVISLGSIERGKPVEKTVKLISAENESFRVSLSNKPESCSVEVREGKGESTLDVTIVPETPGILQGEIELRVQRESETSGLVVKYIGYVR